jgi:tRNA modification GTPase
VEPPLVVAVGCSNIGKSTLLNRLAGRHVAAVADEPGTTRDHIGALVDLDGLVVRFVDTPGIRADASSIEREAWRLAESLVAAADLVLTLGDPSSPPPTGAWGPGAVRVCLRADLGRASWDHAAALSAMTGEGIGSFSELLRRVLVPDEAIERPIPWRFWGPPGPRIEAGSDPGG